jgi:IPT/TIG domain
VRFGSTEAASFTVSSPTSIAAVSPPGSAGPVDVTVTAAKGTSAKFKKAQFKYRPSLTSVSPASGPTVGGTTVTISGTGFAPGSTGTTFKFGAAQATDVSCESSTICTAVSPAHAAGPVDVKVTVGKTTSLKSPPGDRFTYE